MYFTIHWANSSQETQNWHIKNKYVFTLQPKYSQKWHIYIRCNYEYHIIVTNGNLISTNAKLIYNSIKKTWKLQTLTPYIWDLQLYKNYIILKCLF